MKEILTRKFCTLQFEWNERQCRLWVASEAMCLRHGVARVAVSALCHDAKNPVTAMMFHSVCCSCGKSFGKKQSLRFGEIS